MSEPPFDMVFVSSIQSGFEAVRAAAREGIESFGCRALMAETGGAAPASSRDALLGLVERADVLLLIIGARYGEAGASGRSPTEDEFDHARALGKDILVLVCDSPREPAADAFLSRVQGNWDEGFYAPRFTEPGQVVGLTVRSLRELAERRTGGAAGPDAQARAAELAAGTRREGYGSGSRLRVALVPAGAPLLLDPVRLDDAALIDRLAGSLRSAGLVTQAEGIEQAVLSDGITMRSTGGRAWLATQAAIANDGAVVAEVDVAADGMLGSSQVDHERVNEAVLGTGRFSQAVWREIDDRGRVRQVAAAVAIPNAQGKLYVMRSTGNSSPVPSGGPDSVVAPTPGLLLRREDIGTREATNQLAVSLKRAFADHGALYE